MQLAGYGGKGDLSPDLSTENVENYSALLVETPGSLRMSLIWEVKV